MHYLVTGHTGFKGAWLSLMLLQRGHSVSGISLDPLPGSLFEMAAIGELLEHDLRIDIRDAPEVARAVAQVGPDIVMHLAAQPLVRESYRDPRTTFETNVMGTLAVLEAVSATPSVLAHLVVTTDKVYRNVTRAEGYREDEPLGGDDPYSASKAMADILTHSWTTSFPGAPTAVVRAGNVIGGGDVSPDRLLPDLLRAYAAGEPAHIRYPDAVRPWQHVLDCLSGYLAVTDALMQGRGAGEWNLGPGIESFVPVSAVADLTAELWGDGASWIDDRREHPHEAQLLSLDATKAAEQLGWFNRLPFPACLEWTVDWHRTVAAAGDARDVTLAQIAAFGGRA